MPFQEQSVGLAEQVVLRLEKRALVHYDVAHGDHLRQRVTLAGTSLLTRTANYWR